MDRFLTFTLFILLLSQPFQVEARDNPFVSEKPPERQIELPTFASKVLAKIMAWQSSLNRELTLHVKKLKEEMSWANLFPLILVSFFYGIVHAAGPGHGKVVVFSYFMSRRSRVKKGILLGNLISLFHAVSGAVIVLIIYFIIKNAYLSSFEGISRNIKLVSYTLVLILGLVLFFTAVFKGNKGSNHKDDGEISPQSQENKGLLPLALAVGIVPCPGVVIIMLFALSFDLLFIGLAMSFIMALGMAATISTAGLISIFGREGLLKGLSRRERVQQVIQRSLSIFGSLLIIAFGSILLMGTL